MSDELMLHDMQYQNGVLNISLSGEPTKTFFAALIKMFEDAGAKNFLTIEVEHGLDKYAITIQNSNGVDTPSEKLNRQADEIKDLQCCGNCNNLVDGQLVCVLSNTQIKASDRCNEWLKKKC